MNNIQNKIKLYIAKMWEGLRDRVMGSGQFPMGQMNIIIEEGMVLH